MHTLNYCNTQCVFDSQCPSSNITGL